MKFISVLMLLMTLPAQAVSIYRENVPFQWMTQPYRFYHQTDFKFSPLLAKHFGGDYRLTYSLGPAAVDLQVSYLSSNWGSLSVAPGYDDTQLDSGGVISNPASQIAFPRSSADRWTQWIFEAGYSYRGRLVPLDARYWMQAARFSLGYTTMNDQRNHLTFGGMSINTEFSLWYPVLPKVLMGPTFGYRFGWVHLNSTSAHTTTRLPFASLEAGLGASFKL